MSCSYTTLKISLYVLIPQNTLSNIIPKISVHSYPLSHYPIIPVSHYPQINQIITIIPYGYGSKLSSPTSRCSILNSTAKKVLSHNVPQCPTDFDPSPYQDTRILDDTGKTWVFRLRTMNIKRKTWETYPYLSKNPGP